MSSAAVTRCALVLAIALAPATAFAEPTPLERRQAEELFQDALIREAHEGNLAELLYLQFRDEREAEWL